MTTLAPSTIDRIVAIPSVPPADDRGISLVEKWTTALRRIPTARRLRPVQAAALEALFQNAVEGSARGVVGLLGVGHGKTLTTLLAPEAAHAVRPILLVPPSMRDQLQRDIAEWWREYKFTPPRIMAYSELSRATATDYLESFGPDLIVCDEVHSIGDMNSARTRRVIRYMKEHPATRFVGLSGTMSGKGLADFAHILELALREHTPIPDHPVIIDQWASVIDSDGDPDEQSINSIWPLARHYGGTDRPPITEGDDKWCEAREVARGAFKQRLVSIPSVISTREPSVDAALTLTARTIEIPDVVQDALDTLENKWEVGAGDDVEIITDALTHSRAGSQLSCGFYYAWDWPNGIKDEQWLEARKEWNKAVRNVLRYESKAGLDSPMLVTKWAEEGNGSRDFRRAFSAWSVVRDRVPPPVRTIWLSPFVVDDACSFARASGRCLVWYSSTALEPLFLARGIPVYGHGSDSPHKSVDVAALSIPVHGKGKNLQAWSNSLVVQPPASGTTWEQMLGRTHRQGQTASEVTATYYAHTKRNQRSFANARRDAEYIEQTQGMFQKLNFAAYKGVSNGDDV